MPVLQITQQPGTAPNHYRISVRAAEIPGLAALSFDADMEFELKPAEAEGIRWYLEDYLQFDEEPAPQIAKRVEASMAQSGEELFRKIFKASNDATRLWDNLEPYLPSTRIEIDTGIAAATAIPWELIRSPDSYLALSAAAFVRSQRAGKTVLLPETEAAKVRILLIISRPGGGADVPFRSVANRLVAQLNKEAHGAFELHVLRPPTYEQLTRTLDEAKEREKPFHIVHFDGHGVYSEADASAAPVISDLPAGEKASVRHGFLAFESPASSQNAELVDGFKLGTLLNEAGVPVLVLNACQSAYAEARSKPVLDNPGDARQEVEAYGSLAQAVMSKGASGVIAMRYSVLVTTATQFMAELYGALARGRRLGEAVSVARKNLHTLSGRQLAYEPRPLQDWSVPVVWERAPLRLWAEKPESGPLKISLDDASTPPGVLDPEVATTTRFRLLRPRRNAVCAGSRLRRPAHRAAACLRRQRQDLYGAGIRGLVPTDRRGAGTGAVHQLRASPAAGAGARQDRRRVRRSAEARPASSGMPSQICRSAGPSRCRSLNRFQCCGFGTTSSR